MLTVPEHVLAWAACGASREFNEVLRRAIGGVDVPSSASDVSDWNCAAAVPANQDRHNERER